MLLTGVLSFGAGILLGSLINNGRNDWGFNWYGHGGSGSSVKYNNNVYISNNNVYPGRLPGAGYGYRPPNAGYTRPGYPPRPIPYAGAQPPYNGSGGYNRPNNGAIPATRPYNPETAKPYAANNPNLTKPNFPKASTLPNNPGTSNLNRKDVSKNQSNQPVNPAASTRPAAATKPGNRAADQARGYTKDPGSMGGRRSAFGGYEAGGATQTTSGRGQASLKGNQNASGGSGNGGGGGNARRAGGAGNGVSGGNRGGRKQGP